MAQVDVLERYSNIMRLTCEACRPVVPTARWAAEQVIYSWRDQAWEAGLQLMAEDDPARLRQLEQRIERHAVDRVRILIEAGDAEAHLVHASMRMLDAIDEPELGPPQLCERHSEDPRADRPAPQSTSLLSR